MLASAQGACTLCQASMAGLSPVQDQAVRRRAASCLAIIASMVLTFVPCVHHVHALTMQWCGLCCVLSRLMLGATEEDLHAARQRVDVLRQHLPGADIAFMVQEDPSLIFEDLEPSKLLC